MVLQILKQFNWLDVVLVFLLLRISYISIKNGFVVELFKFLGTVFSLFTAFHYFTILSDRFIRRVPEEQSFPVEFMDFLTCVGLLIAVYLLFVLLRNVVCHFIKMEAVPALSKWGGFLIGMGRAVIAASLLVFLLFISTIAYISDSAKDSYIGQRLFNVSVSTYETIWNGFMNKFAAGEKLNSAVREVQQEYFRK